jgi:membrane-associated protease RseP (regulator of RpoE activity)
MGISLIALLLGTASSPVVESQQRRKEVSRDTTEREEINESYQLAPGASIEVADVPFGAIIIEPTDETTASVHVVRSAHTRAELACNRFVVEQTPNGINFRGNENSECRLQNTSVEQSIIFKIPRQVNVTARNITGPLRVGEAEGRGPNFVKGSDGSKVAQAADRPNVVGRGFDGTVRVQSISGPVKIVQGSGETSVSGVSGPVGITFRRFDRHRVNVDGINGMVELLFINNVNADLVLNDIRGEVRNTAAGIKLDGVGKNGYRAQIGTGGSPISLSGINGDLVLRRE